MWRSEDSLPESVGPGDQACAKHLDSLSYLAGLGYLVFLEMEENHADNSFYPYFRDCLCACYLLEIESNVVQASLLELQILLPLLLQ